MGIPIQQTVNIFDVDDIPRMVASYIYVEIQYEGTFEDFLLLFTTVEEFGLVISIEYSEVIVFCYEYIESLDDLTHQTIIEFAIDDFEKEKNLYDKLKENKVDQFISWVKNFF